jgi:hypothetical protein
MLSRREKRRIRQRGSPLGDRLLHASQAQVDRRIHLLARRTGQDEASGYSWGPLRDHVARTPTAAVLVRNNRIDRITLDGLAPAAMPEPVSPARRLGAPAHDHPGLGVFTPIGLLAGDFAGEIGNQLTCISLLSQRLLSGYVAPSRRRDLEALQTHVGLLATVLTDLRQFIPAQSAQMRFELNDRRLDDLSHDTADFAPEPDFAPELA